MRPFLWILHSIVDGLMEGNSTKTTCDDSVISHYSFYQYSLIPAVVLTLLFAGTKKRRRRLVGFLGGRPALVHPMDTLTRRTRMSYCCAFGATAFLVYQILLEQKFAIDYQGPLSFLSLIAILTMFVYGIVYFPVFACLALNSAFSYGLGSLYVWMFLVVNLYIMSVCDLTAKGRAVMLARCLPSVGCLAYLGVSLPVRFIVSCYRRHFFTAPQEKARETVDGIRDSFQGLHVRNLLRPTRCKRNRNKNRRKNTVMEYLNKWIYHSEPGFRYPALLVSVLFVASCVVYMITVELMFLCVDTFDVVSAKMDHRLDEIGWCKKVNEDPLITAEREELLSNKHHMFLVEISSVLSIVFSCAVTCMNILHMMASFRSNLFAMYRGDFKVIPPPSSKSAVWLCTGCIKYSGFQVGFLVWGYIVMWLILFAITFILSMMIDGYLAELVEEIKTICQTWPGVLVAMVLLVLQGLLARFVFLQGSASFLRLDNRNSYFIFAYFMFFYNIFLGVVSCLLRILKAVVIGAVFLARLDSSTLPRRFEAWDSGLSAYTGFVHMEAAHTHPVLNVFVRLLVSLNRTKRLDGLARALDVHITSNDSDINDSQDDQSCPRRNPVGVTAKFKWFLVYTLLHNPQIRLYRQGYIQSVKKARQDGLRVPISDRPIVQFDLTQLRTAQGESDQAIPSPGQDATVSGPATHLVHVPSSVVVSGGTSDADDIDVNMIEDLEDIEDSSGFLRDPMGSGDTELLMPV